MFNRLIRFVGSSGYHCGVVASWIALISRFTALRDGRVPMNGVPP